MKHEPGWHHGCETHADRSGAYPPAKAKRYDPEGCGLAGLLVLFFIAGFVSGICCQITWPLGPGR